MKQYGQIFLLSNTEFLITCTYCKCVLTDYNEFQNHVLEIHLDPLSIDEGYNIIDIKINTPNNTKNNINNFNYDLNIQDRQNSKQQNVHTNQNNKLEEPHSITDITKDIKSIFKKENYDKDEEIQKNENLNNIIIEPIKSKLNCEDVKYITCKKCKKSYSSQHFRTHKFRKRCGTCPFCFKKYSYLDAHLKNYHKSYYEEKNNLIEPIIQKDLIFKKTIEINGNESETKLKNDLFKELNEPIVGKSMIPVKTKEIKENECDITKLAKDSKKVGKIVCVYCGESFPGYYFPMHQAQRRCGKCPVCLSIVTDLFGHVPKYHKEYVEGKRLSKEKVIKRTPLSDNELLKKAKENFDSETESTEEKFDLSTEIIERTAGVNNLEKRLNDLIQLCIYCEKPFKSQGNYNKHIMWHETKSDDKKKLNEPIIGKSMISEKTNEIKENECDITKLANDSKKVEKIVCLYCGESFPGYYFPIHQAQRRCGKCPVCLSIVTDLFRHVRKYHKEYVEGKRLSKEKVIKRTPLSDNELLKKTKEKFDSETESTEEQFDLSTEIIERTVGVNNLEKSPNDLKRVQVCIYCEKPFKSQGNYTKHIMWHETKSDACKYCGKRFTLLSRLKKHLRLHTGERPYKCEICSVSFNESSNLKAHFINIHTQGLNSKCTYENCGKVFKTNARRRYHERYAHSNTYKNLCKECGLIFNNSALLNKHTKTKHTKYEDRQFSCKYCEKKFAFNFELIPHEMAHLGQKRYHCELCTKGFIAKKNLRRHYRTVHRKEPDEITQT